VAFRLAYLTLVRVQVVGTEVRPVDVPDRATRAPGRLRVAFESPGAAPATADYDDD